MCVQSVFGLAEEEKNTTQRIETNANMFGVVHSFNNEPSEEFKLE